jgi:outer membrane protein TolC
VVDYQNKLLQAQAEVDNAIVAYLRAQVRARYLVESANAAERSVQLSFVQYREGATDFNSVLLTLTQQFEQQDALTETNGSIATNLIAMYKALGGGWDVDAERILEDYVDEEDKQQLRTRTKYWGKTLPE